MFPVLKMIRLLVFVDRFNLSLLMNCACPLTAEVLDMFVNYLHLMIAVIRRNAERGGFVERFEQVAGWAIDR
jgi:hypothetical protein